MNKTHYAIAFVLGMIALGPTAHATIAINGDIYSTLYSGTGAVVTTDANTWNNISGAGTFTGLVDSSGNPTPVAFTVGVTPLNVFDLYGTGFNPSGNHLLDDLIMTLVPAGGSSADVVGTWSFSSLEAGGRYELYLYGTSGLNSPVGTTFALTTGTPVGAASASTTGIALGSSWTDQGTTVPTSLQGKAYIVLTAMADGSGVIAGTWTDNGALDPYGQYVGPFNGFQIIAVPEPSTIFLLGLGGLLVWRLGK